MVIARYSSSGVVLENTVASNTYKKRNNNSKIGIISDLDCLSRTKPSCSDERQNDDIDSHRCRHIPAFIVIRQNNDNDSDNDYNDDYENNDTNGEGLIGSPRNDGKNSRSKFFYREDKMIMNHFTRNNKGKRIHRDRAISDVNKNHDGGPPIDDNSVSMDDRDDRDNKDDSKDRVEDDDNDDNNDNDNDDNDNDNNENENDDDKNKNNNNNNDNEHESNKHPNNEMLMKKTWSSIEHHEEEMKNVRFGSIRIYHHPYTTCCSTMSSSIADRKRLKYLDSTSFDSNEDDDYWREEQEEEEDEEDEDESNKFKTPENKYAGRKLQEPRILQKNSSISNAVSQENSSDRSMATSNCTYHVDEDKEYDINDAIKNIATKSEKVAKWLQKRILQTSSRNVEMHHTSLIQSKNTNRRIMEAKKEEMISNDCELSLTIEWKASSGSRFSSIEEYEDSRICKRRQNRNQLLISPNKKMRIVLQCQRRQQDRRGKGKTAFMQAKNTNRTNESVFHVATETPKLIRDNKNKEWIRQINQYKKEDDSSLPIVPRTIQFESDSEDSTNYKYSSTMTDDDQRRSAACNELNVFTEDNITNDSDSSTLTEHHAYTIVVQDHEKLLDLVTAIQKNSYPKYNDNHHYDDVMTTVTTSTECKQKRKFNLFSILSKLKEVLVVLLRMIIPFPPTPPSFCPSDDNDDHDSRDDENGRSHQYENVDGIYTNCSSQRSGRNTAEILKPSSLGPLQFLARKRNVINSTKKDSRTSKRYDL